MTSQDVHFFMEDKVDNDGSVHFNGRRLIYSKPLVEQGICPGELLRFLEDG